MSNALHTYLIAHSTGCAGYRHLLAVDLLSAAGIAHIDPSRGYEEDHFVPSSWLPSVQPRMNLQNASTTTPAG